MKKTVCRLGLVVVLATLAVGAQARSDGEKAVAGAGERLRAGDCAGAVRALNAGLQAGYTEVALLAGTMFESGLCVKKDWGKAVGFYSQAHEGGNREGALRLAAGFAAEENGPDTAAAMWWARRSGLEADHCTARLPKADDPDRFVEELRKWPAPELAVCNYIIGVMSFISAEARYPMAGISREIAGRAEFVYTPAQSHFRMEDRDATGPAMKGYTDVIARSLSRSRLRYRKPGGIPPSWQIPFLIVIDTDKSRWW